MHVKMKKAIRKLHSVKLLALVFLFLIIYVGTATLPAVLIEVGNMMQSDEYDFTALRDALDKKYADMLTMQVDQPVLKNKSTYINLNGLLARLMGQRYMNERIKLNNGHLSENVDILVNIEGASNQMTKLFMRQAEQDKFFLFVMAPWQTSKYDPQIPVGYQDRANESADVLVSALRENNIPVLDLRDKMHEQNISHEDAFFISDHHWKPQTGFWAYTEILAYLEEMQAIPKVDSAYTDADHYEFRLYEEWFLGSAGRRTGKYYAGVDDFHLIIPKFETDMSMEIPTYKIYNAGRFEDVAYDMKALEEKCSFTAYTHNAYGYGDSAFTHWRNENAPIKKKVLMLGDSFINIPAMLLPLCISSCDEMDMRYYKGDFQSDYSAFAPDIVIVLINALLSDGKNVTYDFFPDESNG